MALLAAIGFDHLEALANWYSFMDAGVVAQTSGSPNPRALVTNGWLATANTVASVNDNLAIALRTLAKPGATKVTIGVRCRSETATSVGIAMVSGGSGNVSVGSSGGAGYEPLAVAGGSAYLEFEVPLSGAPALVKRWVNNVQLADASVAGGLASGNGSFYLFMKQASGGRLAFRDIYVLDDTGAEFNTRLGPRKLAPITLDACSAPNWSYTSGSALAALSTPGEDPTVNKATSPLTKDVLTAGLHATIETGAVIEAIVLNMGGKSLAAGTTTLGAKLKSGSDELALPDVVLPITQSVAIGLAIASKAPNGAAWTPALLEATDLVITPDIGA